MGETIRVDYHLHPNLPSNEGLAMKKCNLWWSRLVHHKINTVIITEHSYKNPSQAFSLMNKTCPKESFCFPGIEYLTNEGIDLVIFSYNTKIYFDKYLNSSKLSFNEVLAFIKSKKSYFSYVTHPHTLGKTSIIKDLSYDDYQRAVSHLGSVEISNGSFDNFKLLLKKYPLNFIFRSDLNEIKKIKHLPLAEYHKNIKFLAAGSDAHDPKDVGDCLEIKTSNKKLTRKKVFENLINNIKKMKVYSKKTTFNLPLLFRESLIVFKEYLTKLFKIK